MIGIAEMFAEFDGSQRFWDALEIWGAYKQQQQRESQREYASRPDIREQARTRKARYRANPINRRLAVETMRAWRKANPERAREQNKRNRARQKERKPEQVRKWRRKAYDNYRAKHPDKVREWNRRAQAKRQARLKAQKATA